MKNLKAQKIKVAGMFREERHRVILHVLEVDWPAAITVITAAMRSVGDKARTPECVQVFTRALDLYEQSFGSTDRERLAAFLHPVIDGISDLLMADPPRTKAVIDIETVLEAGVSAAGHGGPRARVIDQLLPKDTSIGRVWRLMQRG